MLLLCTGYEPRIMIAIYLAGMTIEDCLEKDGLGRVDR